MTRHPSKRVWDLAHNKDPHRKAQKRAYEAKARKPCRDCGRLCGLGSHHQPDWKGRCRDCENARRRERYPRIVELWAEGKTLKEIAAEFDTTVNVIGTTMFNMRQQGWDVPRRYVEAA